jgi:AMP-binding enzyme
MSERQIVATPSAYSYPLLIKQLLLTPLMQSPQQEIVYRDVKRLTYADLRDRIGRLGSALAKIGVRPGDTVGVLDWDSNRFLEAFFAIPMMGAILQTVNVRLSPEQVAYTIDHAGSSTLLVNDEFVDLKWTPFVGPPTVGIKVEKRLLFPFSSSSNPFSRFLLLFLLYCGYVGNAFALSKRSGISTGLAAASILSMPARHTAIGIWLLIA